MLGRQAVRLNAIPLGRQQAVCLGPHPVQQAHGLKLLERGQRPGGVGQVLGAEVGQQAQRVAHQRLRCTGLGGEI